MADGHRSAPPPAPPPSPSPPREVHAATPAEGEAAVPDGATLAGASVLPYAISETHDIYFLLGSECDYGAAMAVVWSDFAGKADPADGGSAARTAARELDEESIGLVRAPPPAALEAGAYTSRMVFLARRRSHAISRYDTFLVQIPLDAGLPRRFAVRRQQAASAGVSTVYLEKKQLRFVSAARLRSAVDGRGPVRLRRNFVARARTALQVLGQLGEGG